MDFLVGFLDKKPQTLLIPIYSTTILYDNLSQGLGHTEKVKKNIGKCKLRRHFPKNCILNINSHFKNILKLILYDFLNISLTTSPCLKAPTLFLYTMEITCIWKSTHENSQFTQHIMHKMKPMNFSTQG